MNDLRAIRANLAGMTEGQLIDIIKELARTHAAIANELHARQVVTLTTPPNPEEEVTYGRC